MDATASQCLVKNLKGETIVNLIQLEDRAGEGEKIYPFILVVMRLSVKLKILIFFLKA